MSRMINKKLKLPLTSLERAPRGGNSYSIPPPASLVRFQKYSGRESVIWNAKKLKGTGIYIDKISAPPLRK